MRPEETMTPPKGLIEALHNIKAEDLKYGGRFSLADLLGDDEPTVKITLSEYDKLCTNNTILAIIMRDVSCRKAMKAKGTLSDYKDIVDGDFVERVLGVAYDDEKED